jgi:hypothetical protein
MSPPKMTRPGHLCALNFPVYKSTLLPAMTCLAKRETESSPQQAQAVFEGGLDRVRVAQPHHPRRLCQRCEYGDQSSRKRAALDLFNISVVLVLNRFLGLSCVAVVLMIGNMNDTDAHTGALRCF